MGFFLTFARRIYLVLALENSRQAKISNLNAVICPDQNIRSSKVTVDKWRILRFQIGHSIRNLELQITIRRSQLFPGKILDTLQIHYVQFGICRKRSKVPGCCLLTPPRPIPTGPPYSQLGRSFMLSLTYLNNLLIIVKQLKSLSLLV